MVAAAKLPRPIGRDRCNDVGRGLLDVLDDEFGGEASGMAEAVLLPGVDKRPSRAGVRYGCACGGEGEPAAGTFPAAFDGPRSRSAAAGAARKRKHTQLRAAGPTHRVGGGATGNATVG